MNRLQQSFNSILCLFSLLACAGCGTTQKKDVQYSLIQFHLEARLDGTERTTRVPIFRADPVYIGIQTSPFIDIGYLQKVTLVEKLGSYAVEVQFDETGIRRMESFTTTHRGKRLAIFANFMFEDTEQTRWLGAPVIQQTIKDGILTFTPDASRAETESLIKGLNNAIEEIKKPYVF